MNKSLTLLIFTLLSFHINASVLDQQPEYSRVYDPERNPFEDGRKALTLAKTTGRRVMIEVGGDWCVFCHIFDRFIKSDEEVAKRFFDTFVLLKVNYSDENENRKFLSNFKGINGYPYIFITENTGKVIYANDMREMTIKGKPNKQRLFSFLEKWKLKTDE